MSLFAFIPRDGRDIKLSLDIPLLFDEQRNDKMKIFCSSFVDNFLLRLMFFKIDSRNKFLSSFASNEASQNSAIFANSIARLMSRISALSISSSKVT